MNVRGDIIICLLITQYWLIAITTLLVFLGKLLQHNSEDTTLSYGYYTNSGSEALDYPDWRGSTI